MVRQGSRYALTASPQEVQAVFGYADEVDFPPRYNIAPPQPIAVVHQLHGARHFTLMRWGFVPGWVKDPREISLLATARAETVSERPAFSAAFRRRRALMPASGFYAWRRGPNRQRQAYFVRPPAAGPIALAGLWETWCGADGSEVDTACLFTIEAAPGLAEIADRVPVIIAPGDFERWLGPDEAAADLLRPASPAAFAVEPVSSRVDSPRNEGPDLVAPVAG